MDPSQILTKTAKGQEEIQTKAFELPPQLRRLLILVDGHSTVGETLDRLAVLGGDLETQLEALLADGFVAPWQPAFETGADRLDWAADRPSDGPTGGAAAPRPPRFNLEKAKGFARFIILGSLGPAGAQRVERIDAARGAAELRAELQALRDALPELLPKRQAKQVWDQIEPLMLAFGFQAQAREQWPTLRHPDPGGVPGATPPGLRRQARKPQQRGTVRGWRYVTRESDAGPDAGLKEYQPEAPRRGRPLPPPLPTDRGPAIAPAAPSGASLCARLATRPGARAAAEARARFAARLLEYAEPLTSAADGADAQKRAMEIAIVCWNAATLPGRKGLQTIAPALRAIANGDRKLERELFGIFEIMQARRHAYFREENRFVLDYALLETPAGQRLFVTSRPPRQHPAADPAPRANGPRERAK